MDHYAPVHHLDRGPEALKSGRLEDIMPLVDEHPEKWALFVGIFTDSGFLPFPKEIFLQRNWVSCRVPSFQKDCAWLKKGLLYLYILYWVRKVLVCLYILEKVEIWSGDTDAWLTHWQTTEDRATQLLSSIQFKLSHAIIKNKSKNL